VEGGLSRCQEHLEAFLYYMLVAHYTDAQLGAIEHVVNIGLLRKRKMIPRESFWAPLKNLSTR
jgi:hypothetical protein